ncbi:Kinesin-4 [Hibiscus syriacus]|uniref:Kinesin-4 n=1 Tax=Hibiscus syriacus TaxID=106335 RepID=A0A6A2YX46_HIBSY|nr:Kinesin-4 [Hibiscus syriacus]
MWSKTAAEIAGSSDNEVIPEEVGSSGNEVITEGAGSSNDGVSAKEDEASDNGATTEGDRASDDGDKDDLMSSVETLTTPTPMMILLTMIESNSFMKPTDPNDSSKGEGYQTQSYEFTSSDERPESNYFGKMASDSVIPQVPVISVLEEVLQEHGTRIEDIGITSSRNTDEASLKRNEATGWLRKTVGVVLGKDLPSMPSEDEFRLGLRSGKILCTALNKIQPGSVPNIVDGPSDSVIIPDGDALSEYPFFENVINFLKVVEELGIPPFEATDLEQGGNSSRIVQCVLALKSYGGWKKSGAIDSLNNEQSDLRDAASLHSLRMLVRAAVLHKRQEEIPMIVESMITKVLEEYERRLASHSELSKTSSKDMEESVPDNFLSPTASCDCGKRHQKQRKRLQMKHQSSQRKKLPNEECNTDEESTRQLLKQKTIVEQQQQYVLELKHSLHATKEGMDRLQMMYHKEFSNLGKHWHSLALGYQRVLEENRKLYNQVQDLKGNIRVYCRVRPLFSGQSNSLSCVDHMDDRTITVLAPTENGKGGRKSFTFNKIFSPSVTQAEVFSDAQPLIRSVLDGYNVCIFAYGQTGSGKTYTMVGNAAICHCRPNELTEEGLDVNYRALGDLFELSNQRKEAISYEISVQMLEIYNEQVRDLLAADCQTKKYPLYLAYVYLASLKMTLMYSDANLGQKNRIVCSTAMDRSSRSHSCLTVHVLGKDLTSGNILRGCMHLVDLAGCERVDKSEEMGNRLKSQHIDKSLSALGDVIASLASKSSHVPYRNSKLTQLLQDSLGGQAKTLMFVHIASEYEARGGTLSSLNFAERVATVELGAAKVNTESVEMKKPKDQIASLKAASAAAKREGEPEQVQEIQSVPTSPGRKTPSLETSPSLSQCQSPGDQSSSAEMKEPKDQIASPKAASATAKKEGEPRQVQESQSVPASPEKKTPSLETSPSLPQCQSPSDQSSSVTNAEESSTPSPTEASTPSPTEASSQSPIESSTTSPESSTPSPIESSTPSLTESSNSYRNENSTPSRNESPTSSNKSSEIQEMLADPSLWPPLTAARQVRTVGNGRWNPTKVYPEQNLNKLTANKKGNQENGQQRVRPEVAPTDGSSDIDAATSDRSETNSVWQSGIPKINNGPKGLELKPKKQQHRPPSPATTKNTESKSAVPSPIPSSSNRNAKKSKRKTGYANCSEKEMLTICTSFPLPSLAELFPYENKLSAVGVVEELFEEGSAMLAERLGKDFPMNTNSGIFKCTICQVDQPPAECLTLNSGPFFSPASKPWEGPFLCTNCRKKKDAMEGKTTSTPTVIM